MITSLFLLLSAVSGTNHIEFREPTHPLQKGAYLIGKDEPFSTWSEGDHRDVYRFTQKSASSWTQEELDFLVYGKLRAADDFFYYEVVPVQKNSSWLIRVARHIEIVWKILFFGTSSTSADPSQPYFNPPSYKPAVTDEVQNDPFCDPDVIERQWVLKGKEITVLYSYTPIGLGGERLHFLVIPNKHRDDYRNLTEEEAIEASTTTQKIIDYFQSARTLKEVHILHKSGAAAGQTVFHWHQHIILITSEAQGLLSKLSLFKNMFLRVTPLDRETLKIRALALRDELSHLSE